MGRTLSMLYMDMENNTLQHSGMTPTLFADERRTVQIASGAVLLEGYALDDAADIIAAIKQVKVVSPFRRMCTPNGHHMSVAMTNCGAVGWVSDKTGYWYETIDPETNKPWPHIPDALLALACHAANEAGYHGFTPDVCLINRYKPGTKLSLHRDGDEADFSHSIVSVSLGLPATFLFGGMKRSDKTKKIPLHHGDVFVFGGESRLVYHGIAPLKDGEHPLLGNQRINLTFRKAL